ncbi:MAG: hypothetical protein ACO1RX_07580 [Candidatus Sericytochromatia bacterium]
MDLDSRQTDTARTSRNNLVNQLLRLDKSIAYFPDLSSKIVFFGSFARRTKVRPLDDIDLMVELSGKNTIPVQASSDIYTYWVKVNSASSSLSNYVDNYGYLNSVKVLNKIRNSLSTVSHYSSADIKRNQQAVTLNLNSYSWIFDIVPTFKVLNNLNNIDYFLIPDGSGEWMRTNPLIDQANVSSLNSNHNGNLLPVIRLLKYWNILPGKPVLPSYYFETLILNVFRYCPVISEIPKALKYFFENVSAHVNSRCLDPKNLGPDLDSKVLSTTKASFNLAIKAASDNAWYAVYHEQNSNHSLAIDCWKKIFGSEFPAYG